MNPYQKFVGEYVRLLKDGKSLPLGGIPPAARPELSQDAPKVLIFSPHPDDECIVGALALRLMREARMRVINVAVTQGSLEERKAERYEELKTACQFLGYELIQTRPGGLDGITVKSRQQEPAVWAVSVSIIANIISSHRPKIVFCPHESDWNSKHIGTHFVVLDALQQVGRDFSCYVVETEFWGQMSSPNLMVESTLNDVADMVAGTSFHAGEVRRNPFHLFLPAWMQDNVRRGSEVIGGQGEAAANFDFATLYQLRRWKNERFEQVLDRGIQLSASSNPASLFP